MQIKPTIKINVRRNKVVVLLSLLILFSCAKRKSKYTDKQVFRYNEHSNITSLDPAFAKDQRNIWAVNQLYNGLVQLDDSLQVEPAIAKNGQFLRMERGISLS